MVYEDSNHINVRNLTFDPARPLNNIHKGTGGCVVYCTQTEVAFMRLTMDNRARPLPTLVKNGTGANFRACPDTEITNLIP